MRVKSVYVYHVLPPSKKRYEHVYYSSSDRCVNIAATRATSGSVSLGT